MLLAQGESTPRALPLPLPGQMQEKYKVPIRKSYIWVFKLQTFERSIYTGKPKASVSPSVRKLLLHITEVKRFRGLALIWKYVPSRNGRQPAMSL
jgi:hypothetical protein